MPSHFRETERERRFRLIDAYGFGLLLAFRNGEVEISHLPMLVDRDAGPEGAIRGHVARGNPLAEAFDGRTQLTAVFTGPQAYVSPDWYATKEAVPTWNYAVVHCHGPATAMDDAALTRLLQDLSAKYEAALVPKKPWTVDKLPPGTFERLRKAIVGFTLVVDRAEGKFKLSQNRSRADRAGVIAALRAGGAVDMAALMQEALDAQSPA
jgi:transcriptional regulator